MIDRRKVLRITLLATAAATLAGFAYFIWPTPYRNVMLPNALQNRPDAVCCFAARVNRFTSEVDVLTVAGWQSLSFTKDSVAAKAAAALIIPP